MNKKLLISLGLVATTLVTGLGARQVMGSQAADQCQTSAFAYTDLITDQTNDMAKLADMADQVSSNPWSAFGLMGPMTTVAYEVKDRWDDIEEAQDSYVGSCKPESGVYATIVTPYLADTVSYVEEEEDFLGEVAEYLDLTLSSL